MTASLRDLACPACGGRESRLRFEACDRQLGISGPFFASECGGCGLLFQNPRIAEPDIQRHYPGDYAPYRAAEITPSPALLRCLKRHLGYAHLQSPKWIFPDRRHLGARRRADELLIPRFVPGGRLLEIGCASGARLALFRNLGWTDCIGIEYSAGAAEEARARGFHIVGRAVEDALEGIPDGSLDAVIAGFVMEHLEDPFGATARIAAKLRPGGQFLFSTIRIGAPDFNIYGKYWHSLDLPRHMTLFRMRDIVRMLEGSFHVERVTHLAAPQDWFRSARHRLSAGESGIARPFDRLIAGAGHALRPACAMLARLRLTSRVAVRCRKA